MTLLKQTFLGMLWVFIDYFLLKGVSFIGAILLARLLTPNDYGLIAMIAIIVTIGGLIVESGLSSSLIRNVNNEENDYSTVFLYNLFLSLILYTIFFILAPFISDFYGRQELTLLVRVYCVSFVFIALNSVQTSILVKKMEFKKLTLLNIPGIILGNSLGILMGLNGYGVWSIVGMYLFIQFFHTISLWLGSKWKPKLLFSKEKLRYHLKFGNKLLISSLITGVFSNIYNVVLGKFYPLKTTGYFERAYTLSQYPLIVLTQIIGKVTFPLLSNLQEEKQRINEIFGRLINFTAFITAPIMFGLSVISKPFIHLVLGEKWMGVVPIFEILCFGGLFYTLQALNVNILKIYGRSDLILKAEILLKIQFSLMIFVAFQIGFIAIIWSLVLNSFITLISNMYCVNKVISYSIIKQFRSIVPIFLASGLMYLFMNYIQTSFCGNMSNLTEIFLLIICGVIIYLSLSFLFKIPTFIFGVNFMKKNLLKLE
jgi:O-antigen/teichoic acid export membrane protein